MTPGALNQNQVRHVVSTFTYVDSLLQAVERVSTAGESPFAKEQRDLATDEARLLTSFVKLTRDRMLAALDQLGIPRPRPKLSARWSAETSLKFAETALADLTAEHLRGYGELDERAALELAALAGDLDGVLRRARHVLHEADADGLSDALAKIPGVVGDVLRELDRVSREQALAEVRPLLAAAAERALGGTFDVGVFGRVSAGKSSLINALVGEAVLPVGATPVTAVPTRLSRGPHGAVVHLLSGEQRSISIGDIAEYATEERNPDNHRGVRAIEVTAPTVPEGLRLLDTPGVGSLGTSGPALAFQWLPRCDVGLVLVAAASAVGRDDLALVTGLRQAGIRCVVLLSKADLLADAAVAGAINYVRRELSGAIDGSARLDVQAVSTAPGHDRALGQFREHVLTPLARDHAREARKALQRRLERLVRATAEAMKGRAGGAADRGLDLARARAQATDQVRHEVDRIDGAGPVILEAAARAATRAWQEGEDAQSAVRNTIVHTAAESLGNVTHALDGVRELAGGGSGARRVPPLFDPELLDALPPLPAPPIAKRLVGHTVAVHRLEPVAKPLGVALQRYASRLYAWGMGAIEELGAASWDNDPEEQESPLPPALERLASALRNSEAESPAELALPSIISATGSSR